MTICSSAFIVLCVIFRSEVLCSNFTGCYPISNENFQKMYTFVLRLEQINEYFERASIYYHPNWVGISFLDLCGSLLVCRRYRDEIQSSKSWFEALVACTLMQFGGTTLTGILLGQTPSWIISHTAFPALLLAYWLTFCCPFDVFWILLLQLPLNISKVVLGVFASLSSGHAVTSWGQDKATFNTFHVNQDRISMSVMTCILSGTFSASGGGIIADSLGFFRIPSFTFSKTPGILTIDRFSASATFNRAFLLSCLYYCLTSKHYMPWKGSLVPIQTGRLIVGILQLLNYIIQLLDPQMDIFQRMSTGILHFCSIPHIVEAHVGVGQLTASSGTKQLDIKSHDSRASAALSDSYSSLQGGNSPALETSEAVHREKVTSAATATVSTASSVDVAGTTVKKRTKATKTKQDGHH